MNVPADVTSEARTRQLAIAGGLLTAASVGAPIFIPLAFPDLNASWARVLLAVCAVVLCVGLFLFWSAWRIRPDRAPSAIARHWRMVGFGQGWIEVRVRNNAGAAFVVSANPGDTADQIAFDVTFTGDRKPKRSETVELVLEIGKETFELDIPDDGGSTFGIHAKLWRETEHLRQIVSAFRRGHEFRASVPTAGLAATFTLENAYDALSEVENLGQPEPEQA